MKKEIIGIYILGSVLLASMPVSFRFLEPVRRAVVAAQKSRNRNYVI